MQAQRTDPFVSVRLIVLAFALLATLLLASAAGYMIRGGTSSTGAVVQQTTRHEQAPDAITRNQDLQQAKGFKGPDALERDSGLRP